MAANMMWGHEIIHYLKKGHFNVNIFLMGLLLTIIITFFLLRNQYMVDDNQYLLKLIIGNFNLFTSF